MKDWQISGILKDFIADQDGVTSIEYALFAALIILVIVASVATLGTTAEATYYNIARKIRNAIS